MFSISQSAANIIVFIVMPNGEEKPLGWVTRLSMEATQGQRVIFGVDSPFPVQIAQAAQPSMVRGSMSIVLLKNASPDSLNLVPYRNNGVGDPINVGSHYVNFRLYDRVARKPIYTIFGAKISGFSIDMLAQAAVTCQLAFEAMYLVPHA